MTGSRAGGRRAERFEAELVEGHKGVVVALVPFHPEKVFGQPVRLAGRRHGWLVSGSLNGTKFDGYIGERWGRFFVIVDTMLRQSAGVAVGDRVSVVLAPSEHPKALEKAIEQSRQTTEPSKARTDVKVAPGTSGASRSRRAVSPAGNSVFAPSGLVRRPDRRHDV